MSEGGITGREGMTTHCARGTLDRDHCASGSWGPYVG